MRKKRLDFKRFISAFLVSVLALSVMPESDVKASEVVDLVGDVSDILKGR